MAAKKQDGRQETKWPPENKMAAGFFGGVDDIASWSKMVERKSRWPLGGAGGKMAAGSMCWLESRWPTGNKMAARNQDGHRGRSCGCQESRWPPGLGVSCSWSRWPLEIKMAARAGQVVFRRQDGRWSGDRRSRWPPGKQDGCRGLVVEVDAGSCGCQEARWPPGNKMAARVGGMSLPQSRWPLIMSLISRWPPLLVMSSVKQW